MDSRYTNTKGLLTPYKGERYHLLDYRGPSQPPKDHYKLFNYRYSSLRNVIEGYFGTLKAQLSIARDVHNYNLCKQHLIPIVCCVLHNFIQWEKASDRLFENFHVQDMVNKEEWDISMAY